MENQSLTVEQELINLKAAAYDLSKQINTNTAVLQQVNARIEQLTQELNKQSAISEDTSSKKKTK